MLACCIVCIFPTTYFILSYFMTLPSFWSAIAFVFGWTVYLGFYGFIFFLYVGLGGKVMEQTLRFAEKIRHNRYKLRYSTEVHENKMAYIEVFIFLGLNLAFITFTAFLYFQFNYWIIKYTALIYLAYIFGLVASFPLRSNKEEDLEIRDIYYNTEVKTKLLLNSIIFSVMFVCLDFYMNKGNIINIVAMNESISSNFTNNTGN